MTKTQVLVWTRTGKTVHLDAGDGLTVCGRPIWADASRKERDYWGLCRKCQDDS